MTALDEIQKATRDLAGLGRREQQPSAQEVLEALENLREKIRAFIAEVRQLYESATLISSKLMSAGVAAEVWKDLHANFSGVLEVFERLPMLEPQSNSLIKHATGVVRSIVDRADEEYRSYAETAYLLRSNANAIALARALEEAESGNLPLFESGEDLLKSLREK